VTPVSEAVLLGNPASNVARGPADLPLPTFDQLYEEHFAFVWRNVRSLGVPPSSVEDVVQDAFVVVHRRLADFDPTRASLRTWLFGILRRTVADHRRTLRRKPAQFGTKEGDAEVLALSDTQRMGPHEVAARAEALKALAAVLDELDDEKREVFVLAEIEQMSVPEIAQAIDINVNTAYARLRAARKDFEEAVKRRHAKDGWRMR
jgi:RNA polymerase sigma-70 factor (ECF subfamily)